MADPLARWGAHVARSDRTADLEARVRELEAEVATLRAALDLLPSAGAQPEPSGGHGDVLVSLAALVGEEQSRLRGLVLARRRVGVARYGGPLRYGSGVVWLRELRHELVDGAAYALGAGWGSLARRLLGLAGRVQARMDGEVERG